MCEDYVTIWRGQDCKVRRMTRTRCPEGPRGLLFEYKATRSGAPAPICSFTLFCEVGEPYKKSFEGFFDAWVLGEPVEHEEYPYLSDTATTRQT